MDENRNNLNAARGMLNGCAIAALIWAIIIVILILIKAPKLQEIDQSNPMLPKEIIQSTPIVDGLLSLELISIPNYFEPWFDTEEK